jgi:hypothetical protein
MNQAAAGCFFACFFSDYAVERASRGIPSDTDRPRLGCCCNFAPEFANRCWWLWRRRIVSSTGLAFTLA